ncbi:MAG: hypothetical protein AB1345_09510 [Chloroflexota bacterium]
MASTLSPKQPPPRIWKTLQEVSPLLGAILLALTFKFWLVCSEAVPFNSDEAVVGLMARHILQGEKPTFFYGQAYMGSLDAWLTAGMFYLLGESVLAIRFVQVLLFGGYLYTLWRVVRLFVVDPGVGDTAVFLAAVPPVLLTTYTTATLGGYGEIILLGNLIVWIGYEVTWVNRWDSWWAWGLLGLVGGLGLWVSALTSVYLLPILLSGLWRFSLRRWTGYASAAAGFLLSSSPWWTYHLFHAGSTIQTLWEAYPVNTNPLNSLVGFSLLGVPTLLGLRLPWSPELSPRPVQLGLLMIYLGTLVYYLTSKGDKGRLTVPGAGNFMGLFLGGFLLFFIASPFGYDASGRYLLPLYLPLFLFVAAFIRRLWKKKIVFGLGLLVMFLGVNGFETWRAAVSIDKLTTQLDPITRMDNQADEELLAFLDQENELRGYTNYWVSFRLAFLSRERMIFSPRLPYKADLSYSPRDNRYPSYDEIVSLSDQTAYITSKHPRLKAVIRDQLETLGVSFVEKQIGDYHIFYGLSRPVRPEEFNFAEVGG